MEFSPGTTFEIKSPIDPHVHMRGPGVEHKGTYTSETMAAAAGGIAVVGEMPNSPHPFRGTSVDVMQLKRGLIVPRNTPEGLLVPATMPVYVDTVFHWELVPATDDNIIGSDYWKEHLRAQTSSYLTLGGAAKAYLNVTTGQEQEQQVGAYRRSVEVHSELAPDRPIMIHAESGPLIKEFAEMAVGEFGQTIYVAHLSNREELEAVMDLREKYGEDKVTCGVCMHHLFLTQDDRGEVGWYRTMKPLLGDGDDVAFLRQHLAEHVNVIETDHAPHTKEEKDRANELNPDMDPTMSAKGSTCFGVTGLEAMLPFAMKLINDPNVPFSMEDLEKLTHDNPKKLFGVNHVVGNETRITFGETEFTEDNLFGMQKHSPYLGLIAGGVVNSLELAGRGLVFKDGEIVGEPRGKVKSFTRR